MIEHGLCTVAKRDFLSGGNHISDRFMLALYDERASLGPGTLEYERKGEVEGRGYRPGGVQLRNAKVWADDSHGYLTFDSVRIPNTTLTAYGALVYNASKGNRAVAVIDFGGAYTSTVGDFFINIPADAICFL